MRERQALREELAARNAERGSIFWIMAHEDEARELMAGRVPDTIAEMCRTMLDWSLETGQLDFAGMREQQQTYRAPFTGRNAEEPLPDDPEPLLPLVVSE